MADKIEPFRIDQLALDPLNPRLPERVQGSSPSEILKYLFEHANLEELAQSLADNGFFAHEPLIILKGRNKPPYSVLEGNRRLATLLILHNAPVAEGLAFLDVELTPQQKKVLSSVPCYAIDDREEVHAFLGFRHIGGIKTWSPEAKARYLLREIDKAAERKSPDPFREVGRRVGSNALGVRTPYVAIKILQVAVSEFGIDTSFVQLNRFGVWLRCMNSEEIRDFIGFGSARTYEEVRERLGSLKKKQLSEVIADLTPQKGQRQALLVDSRDATSYGRVLANDEARAALRKYRDLSVATQIIDELELPERIRRITEACKIVLDQFHRVTMDNEIADAVEGLYAIARSLSDIATGRLKEKKQK